MNPDEPSLVWLMAWYESHCNGEWEHHNGISLESLDNPGWLLAVDLKGTALETTPFQPVAEGNPHQSWWPGEAWPCWWDVKRVEDRFMGACGAKDLGRVLAIFRHWAERQEAPAPPR